METVAFKHSAFLKARLNQPDLAGTKIISGSNKILEVDAYGIK